MKNKLGNQPATDYPGELAVISPCSSCKKYSNPDTNNQAGPVPFPPCPRYFWKQQNEEFKKGNRDDEVPAYLTATGTEDQDTLRNPVYSRDLKSVLLWVAKVVKNRPVMVDGIALTGDLLEPGYDTNFIECETFPYVCEETQQSLWSRGVYREWDRVVLTPILRQQLEFGSPRPIHISGSAKKVNFHADFSNESSRIDKIVSGT